MTGAELEFIMEQIAARRRVGWVLLPGESKRTASSRLLNLASWAQGSPAAAAGCGSSAGTITAGSHRALPIPVAQGTLAIPLQFPCSSAVRSPAIPLPGPSSGIRS